MRGEYINTHFGSWKITTRKLALYIVLFSCLQQVSGISEENFVYIEEHHNSDSGNYSDQIFVNFSTHDLLLSGYEEKNVSCEVLSFSENITNIELEFNSTPAGVIRKLPNVIVDLTQNQTQVKSINIKANSFGHTLLTTSVGPLIPINMTDTSQAFVRISVYHSSSLNYLSDIVGWIYFTAWSISFYPQTCLNWRRKSVIGLHFDFLSLNVIGFLFYSIFNIGLYFIPEIQREYFLQHRYGVNPVQLNDVIFSIHAFFACCIQVIQCILYERGDQRISRTGRSLLGSFTIMSVIMLILGGSSVIAWIDFLYFVSYIKLFITSIKYIPQAYYNYLRKSTSGWSIGNVLLDFTGGFFSICQMLIISYNYDDWGSIFGDPTKFGLGMFSIIFDIFFIVQHYVLYKGNESYIAIHDSNDVEHSNSVNSDDHINYGSVKEEI